MGQTQQGYKKNKYNIRPIFIVGVPRCGSTLIEKIIASGQRKISIGEETAIISTVVGDEIIKRPTDNLDIQSLNTRIVEEYKQKKIKNLQQNPHLDQHRLKLLRQNMC